MFITLRFKIFRFNLKRNEFIKKKKTFILLFGPYTIKNPNS